MIPWLHVLLLGGEAFLVAGVALALFWTRRWLGLTPLFIFVGSNQYLQTILVSTFEVPLPGGTTVSPGSVVIFAGGLFAVLLVYVKESIDSSRSFIVGIIVANVTLTLLSAFTALQVEVGQTVNRLAIPMELFQLNARVFLSGTTVLVFDCLLMVVAYEVGRARFPVVPMFARLWLVLVGVLLFDSVLFSAMAFGSFDPQALGPRLAWMAFTGTAYATVLTLALRGVEESQTRDVWSLVAWQTEYENLRTEHQGELLVLIDELRAAGELLEQRVEERTADLADSEARYRQLIELSPEPIVVEADGKVALCNTSARDLLGVTDDWCLSERVHDDDRQRFDDWWSCLALDSDSQLFQMTGVGGSLQAQISARRLVTGGRMAVVRDVSEQQRVAQLKDDFVATVNHEIRTPLTAIKGSMDLVLAGVGEPSPQVSSILEVGARNADRLIRLVTDLLDLQKIDAGHMPFQIGSADVVPIVHTAVAGIRSLTLQRHLAVEVIGENVLAEIDPDRLIQVLTNLIGNALRHSPDGGTVTIRVLPGVRIEVSDEGHGIAPEDRDQLFERFKQARSRHVAGGTGLGLAISRSLLEEMGGRLDLGEEQEGKGAIFVVHLRASST